MSDAKTITMSDGRIVVFGKRQKCRKEIISETEIRFDYLNGKVLVFDISKCEAETQRNLGLHGGKQKIGDEGSDEDSADSYHAVCAAMIDRLYAGTAFERAGGGGFQDTILIEALVRATGQSYSEVAATMKTCDAAERAALRTDETVAKFIKEVEAERSKDVNAADVMKKFVVKQAE